jgi:hypothetical protein
VTGPTIRIEPTIGRAPRDDRPDLRRLLHALAADPAILDEPARKLPACAPGIIRQRIDTNALAPRVALGHSRGNASPAAQVPALARDADDACRGLTTRAPSDAFAFGATPLAVVRQADVTLRATVARAHEVARFFVASAAAASLSLARAELTERGPREDARSAHSVFVGAPERASASASERDERDQDRRANAAA